MSDFDFLNPIPKTVVPVKLPSRGVLYPKGTAMCEGTLNLSPMTMVEEAIFFNAQGEGNPVDKILKRCIAETVDVNALLGSDKFFLFLMLRAITYGSDYTFTWTCPARKNIREVCGHVNTKTVHIPNDFQMKYLDDSDKEPFKVLLPESQKEIAFRLLRGYDEPEIEQYVKDVEEDRKRGIMREKTVMAFRLTRQIIEVDGKSTKGAPRDKFMSFILSLSARDTQFLKEKISFYTPGINTDVRLVCEACGESQEGDLPVTAEFFRVVNQTSGGTVADEVRADVLPENEPSGDTPDGPSGAEVPPPTDGGGPEAGDRVREDEARRLAPRGNRKRFEKKHR